MQLSRRSFLASLVAAVVLSPAVCRLKSLVEVSAPEARTAELWEQSSEWDGSLSPYFVHKYHVNAAPAERYVSETYLKKRQCS
jgi:hypothetical protein